MQGFLRPDGRKGIRNITIVAYLVECAHHVARAIVTKADDPSVHLVGFPGCYPNSYALKMMKRLATHPNVGSVLLISLGCEGFNRSELGETVAASGRSVETLIIQEAGGRSQQYKKGLRPFNACSSRLKSARRFPWTYLSWLWGQFAEAVTAQAVYLQTRLSDGALTG